MRILTLMLAALALALPSLAAAQTYTPAQTAFREFYRGRTATKVYPPDTVQPQPYAVELYNRGYRPDLTAPDSAIPDWALAEMYGRAVLDRWKVSGGLPSQMGGKWRDTFIGVSDSFTSRMLWARGPLPLAEAAPYIMYGSYSYPADASRILSELGSVPTTTIPNPVKIRKVTVEYTSGFSEIVE